MQPWLTSRVFAVKAALPARYRAMVDLGGGCGLRQDEIFGLSVDEVNFETGWLHVAYQVKCVHGRLVFAPPKGARERGVPLPGRVAEEIGAHMGHSPPVEVTLPWLVPDGRKVTKTLLFTGVRGDAIRQAVFNTDVWKPALVTAEVVPKPAKGHGYELPANTACTH